MKTLGILFVFLVTICIIGAQELSCEIQLFLLFCKPLTVESMVN